MAISQNGWTVTTDSSKLVPLEHVTGRVRLVTVTDTSNR